MATATRNKRKPSARGTKSSQSKWKWVYLVHIYRWCRQQLPENKMCKLMRISEETYWKWKKEIPEITETLEMARTDVLPSSLSSFCFQQLSPDLRGLYLKVMALHEKKGGIEEAKQLLEDNSKEVRQMLFLHCLVDSYFSQSEALKRMFVTKKELDRWIDEEPLFAELVLEIEWHKRNFFESSLIRLVESGDASATIFANKTLNAERGYGLSAKLKVEHSGSVMHGVLDLSELMPYMDEMTQSGLLEAIRKRDESSKLKQLPIVPRKPEEYVLEQVTSLPDSIPSGEAK